MKNDVSPLGRVKKASESPKEKLSKLAFDTFIWIVASTVLYYDYFYGSILVRIVTLDLLPIVAVTTSEMLVLAVGLMNIVVNSSAILWCFFSDYQNIGDGVLRILKARSRYQPTYDHTTSQKVDARQLLSESVGELIFNSMSANNYEQQVGWANRSLPLPPTRPSLESYLPSTPRSLVSNRSVMDIHNMYQLDESFNFRTPTPDELFDPSMYYDAYRNRRETSYQVSTFEKKVEQDDESLVDLLDVASYYASHPDEHPLTNTKKITSTRDDYFSGPQFRKRRTKPVEESARSVRSRRSGSTSFVPRPSRSPTSIAHKPISIDVIDLIDSYDLDSCFIPRYEEQLRLYVGTHIVIPLVQSINALNSSFRNLKDVPGYSIGRTKIEDLEALCTTDLHSDLKNLPFVLRYLKAHPNTKHLINRITMWSQMAQLYCFNSISTADSSLINFPKEPATKEALPTDSELLLKLFATYLDFSLSPFPLTFNRKPDAPFSNVFIVEPNGKPNSLQLGSLGYYIEVCDTTPTSFKYHAHHRSRWITTATENGLVVLLAFIAHTEMYFSGFVHGTDLATIGLTLHELEQQ